ncbi:MAG: hypothetical protein K2X38_17495 [Gemmataceae bacterium]|nr:hypothetical protein [Gemmataceae bacterium]
MKTLISLCLLAAIGCESGASRWTVSGSAFVETERPEGKAVAKIEVRYTPQESPPRPSPRKPAERPAPAERPTPVERPTPADAPEQDAAEAECR